MTPTDYRPQARSGPLVIPAGPLLSFPPVSPITNVGDKVSGNPVSCFVVPSFVCPCMGKAMDSRLTTSGMTEGGLKASGMTEGLPGLFVMPRHPLTPALSRKGRGRRMRLCHARRAFSVMPAGPPLSFPPVSPITNVGDKVSGNPGSCSSVPSFGWPCMGKAVDSRLKMSGMTEEDYQPSIETVEGRLWE